VRRAISYAHMCMHTHANRVYTCISAACFYATVCGYKHACMHACRICGIRFTQCKEPEVQNTCEIRQNTPKYVIQSTYSALYPCIKHTVMCIRYAGPRILAYFAPLQGTLNGLMLGVCMWMYVCVCMCVLPCRGMLQAEVHAWKFSSFMLFHAFIFDI
jgi:hypothetical protein